jgi:hypothetical protein
MTSETLYGILQFLDTLDNKLKLQTSLEAIASSLDNLVSAPAQPQYQSDLASGLTSFESAASRMAASMSPSQLAAVEAMGGEEFFDPSLFDKVKNSVQMNAMTPAVARDFVKDLAKRRATFLATVRSVRKGLESLGVQESGLQPGSADMAFLIPRGMFENQLGPFATELKFISRLIEHYSEAITGTAQEAQLEELSSSVPTVALVAAVPVVGAIAAVVNKFLEAWEKIERIRKVRVELTDMGIRRTAVDELTEEITTTVDEVVEESTELVLANYKGDGGRRSELENGIRQVTQRLFGQIERGLTVEFRVKANANEEEPDVQKSLETIETIASALKFPEVSKEPMLLGSGEVLEGELLAVKQSKRTTTHKTTVSRKGTKDGGAEPKE